jgi:hypothetical protein
LKPHFSLFLWLSDAHHQPAVMPAEQAAIEVVRDISYVHIAKAGAVPLAFLPVAL